MNKEIHNEFSHVTVQVITDHGVREGSHGSVNHMIFEGGSYLCIATGVRVLISLIRHEKEGRDKKGRAVSHCHGMLSPQRSGCRYFYFLGISTAHGRDARVKEFAN